jgi:hypothetical protein
MGQPVGARRSGVRSRPALDPYALDYDLVILGGALCFLVADARERGWMRHEKSILALAYVVPLFGRQIASLTLIPIDWIGTVAIFTLTLRRAWLLDIRDRLPWSLRALA